VTGSHTKHVLHTNVNCGNCHTGSTTTTYVSVNHFDGNIDVAVGPTNITKHAAGSGYSSCSNVTCHNGGTGVGAFTAPAVTWGQTLNCGGCHGYPPPNNNHIGVNPGTCNSCHNNVNPGGTINNSTFANIQLHMDGSTGPVTCNSCHGYPPVRVSDLATVGHQNNYTSARVQNYSGGGGVHAVKGHLALATKASQGFSAACAACHYGVNSGTTHNLYGNFSTHHVQVVIDPKFKFDRSRPIVYNGVRTGASKTSGTCSNVACHFQKTPLWASETYTKRN
jgi:predicted CxxxxCH...CXXCH cytochrome family protein